MVMAGQVEPVQLGAFLCLLRVRTETPDEVAGLAAAIRETIKVPAGAPTVDLDWASYAGKARQLPYYVLAALTMAQHGIKVFMHGAEHHTAGGDLAGRRGGPAGLGQLRLHDAGASVAAAGGDHGAAPPLGPALAHPHRGAADQPL
jgi:hypothetical protein